MMATNDFMKYSETLGSTELQLNVQGGIGMQSSLAYGWTPEAEHTESYQGCRAHVANVEQLVVGDYQDLVQCQ
jgi:hypothetical protein